MGKQGQFGKARGGCCGHPIERVPVIPVRNDTDGLSRRDFLVGLGTAAIATWAVSEAAAKTRGRPRFEAPGAPPLKPLVVQPALTYQIHQRRELTSWRPWGGIMTKEDVEEEKQRITAEIEELAAMADFPLNLLPVRGVTNGDDAAQVRDTECDVTLIYAAGGGGNLLDTMTSAKRPTVMFLRHRSGPVSLWYEIVHPRFLRKTVDEYAALGVDVHDVVVDEYDDVLWRLRALYGLKNAWGERIVAIGDASGWGAGGRKAPQLARDIWHIEIIPVSYDDLGKHFKTAAADDTRVARAKADADAYLKPRGVKLETRRKDVENGFLLTDVFKDIMREANARAITINHCMGTIMQVTETTACLPLCLLNDEGYMAFCESDFVVIPSGILLHHISGVPSFLQDPTTPHHGIVTLAHCTGPRKMDGRRLEPVRIMTHFESDFGAAPKVEFRKGQVITCIDPCFSAKRWMGFRGETLETPFMEICRAQVDVTIEGNWEKLLQEMGGFHWMLCYGDYRKELGYACRKAGIEWVDVSKG
jgi:hypothetical protein